MTDSTIACLLVTRLPVKAERQRYPALRRRPLVITESCGPDPIVLDSSQETRGVTPGMSVPQALARCPEAIVLTADPQLYAEVSQRMAAALAQRCPVVDEGEPGCVYAGLEGIAPGYGGEARLIASLFQILPPVFELRIGIASARFPAYVSAASSPPGRVIKAPPAASGFLSSRSVQLLPISPEGKARLHRAGIHTLGHLAALTLGQAQAHLGPEGRPAWELTHGIDPLANTVLSRTAA